MRALKTIYYGYPGMSSFVELDIEQLSAQVRVVHRSLKWKSKSRLFLNVFLQALHLIRHFRSIDVVVLSFAGYHSHLPVLYARLRRIPVFIILNGTDSVGIKELNYGSHLKKLLRSFCKKSIRKATELWPVCGALIEGRNTFIGKELHYGVRQSFPYIKTPAYIIPNGFETGKWSVENLQPRKGALTAVSPGQFHLKGVDLFIETAKAFPDLPFTIVGMQQPEDIEAPVNVHFLGKVPHARMKEIFAEHRYYFQLSSFEGFGCALCEAMLSGCIPVGSDVNAIPEIIGKTGMVIRRRDAGEVTAAIRSLEQESAEELDERSRSAIRRITEQYPLDERISTMFRRMEYYLSEK